MIKEEDTVFKTATGTHIDDLLVEPLSQIFDERILVLVVLQQEKILQTNFISQGKLVLHGRGIWFCFCRLLWIALWIGCV